MVCTKSIHGENNKKQNKQWVYIYEPFTVNKCVSRYCDIEYHDWSDSWTTEK